MPSGTTIQQLVNDLKERKSTIARKFDKCYEYCKKPPNASYKTALVTAVGNWIPGNATTLPDLAPAADPLTVGEKAHISEWPDADQVKAAILTALNNDRPIEFFWDLNDDLTVIESKSNIDPPSAGQPNAGAGGKITVTFLTPRGDFIEKQGPTYGQIKLHVTPP
jgi:hypothetical protein